MLQRGVTKLKFGNCRLGIEAPQGILPFLSQSAEVIAWKRTQLLLMASWTWLHYRYCELSYLQLSHSSWQRYRIWKCIKQGSQIIHSIVATFPEELSPGASAKAKQVPHQGLYGGPAVATIFYWTPYFSKLCINTTNICKINLDLRMLSVVSGLTPCSRFIRVALTVKVWLLATAHGLPWHTKKNQNYWFCKFGPLSPALQLLSY